MTSGFKFSVSEESRRLLPRIRLHREHSALSSKAATVYVIPEVCTHARPLLVPGSDAVLFFSLFRSQFSYLERWLLGITILPRPAVRARVLLFLHSQRGSPTPTVDTRQHPFVRVVNGTTLSAKGLMATAGRVQPIYVVPGVVAPYQATVCLSMNAPVSSSTLFFSGSKKRRRSPSPWEAERYDPRPRYSENYGLLLF